LEQTAYDAERTAFLELQGYQVLRFWNHEVLDDSDGVMRAIFKKLGIRFSDKQAPSYNQHNKILSILCSFLQICCTL